MKMYVLLDLFLGNTVFLCRACLWSGLTAAGDSIWAEACLIVPVITRDVTKFEFDDVRT